MNWNISICLLSFASCNSWRKDTNVFRPSPFPSWILCILICSTGQWREKKRENERNRCRWKTNGENCGGLSVFLVTFQKGQTQVNLVFIMAEDWTGNYWAAINHEFHHGLSRLSYLPEWPSPPPSLGFATSLLVITFSIRMPPAFSLFLFFKLYNKLFLCFWASIKYLNSNYQTPTTFIHNTGHIINNSHVEWYPILYTFLHYPQCLLAIYPSFISV